MTRTVLFLVFFAALAAGATAQERLRVVATTSDLRSLAKAVGAEQVTVSSLVPPGEQVEQYQPHLQDAAS